MADGNVYSSKQFELYIALQDKMGTVNATNDDFVKLDVVSVSDIDFGGGLVQERTLRSGQQIKKSTDHYVSQKGASASVQFEWVVSHREGFDMLMTLISEDTGTPFVRAGESSPLTYDHDGTATVGKFATVIVSNPRSTDDRVMHSAVLTELSLTMDSGSEGGRMVVGGTFYSGYKPEAPATNAVAPNGAQTAYVKTIYDFTTKTIASADVVLKSCSVNWTFPALRVGFQGGGAEAQQYSRSGEYALGGSLNVKYDANTDQELASFLAGTPKALVLTDSTPTLAISVPTAIFTGYNLDLGDSDEGVFVELPFEAVADGSANLFSITTA